VPRLRFPEFWDDGDWEEEKLENLGEFTGGGTPSKSNRDYWNGNIPWISSSDVVDESIYQVNISRFISEEALRESATKLVPPNSILLVSRVGVGKLAITVNPVCTSQDFTNFTPTKDNLIFLAYLLKSREKNLISLNQGTSIRGFTREDIGKFKICYPSNKEQQKIADCLSSIGDRITTETQKLDTLKAHKKGLMQQLFPAESETLPKLRFPEFQDAGEWEEDDLSKLSSCGLSNGVFNDPKKVGRGYKLINVLDMYIDTAINEDNLSLVELSREEFLKNKVENGDLFFTRSSLVKSGIAYSNIYLGNSSDITFDGHLIRFRPNKEILIPTFINYLLRTNKVRSQLVARGKTATMTTIGQADVGNVKLSFPHIDEQQKIVDCLSSIDDRITAQIQKIDTLKTHKKGLMQQLFPSVEEVKA